MLPELSLTSVSVSKSNSNPTPKPISLDIIKDSIPKRLDQLRLGFFHLKIIIVCSLLLITHGFELAYVFFQQYYYEENSYMKEKYYDYMSKGWFLFGQAAGTTIFSLVTIHKGRLLSFRILIILYCIGSFSLYFIRNQESVDYQKMVYYMMNLFRCIIGSAIGGLYISVFTGVDEVIPKKRRGQINFMLMSTFIPLGIIMFVLVELIFNYLSSSKLILNLTRLIPLFFTFPLLFVGNYALVSPRWELFTGRFRDAVNMINEIDNFEDQSIIVL